MKFFCAFAFTLLVAVCAEDTYTTENDNLDIEAVVADPKTLQAFTDCFLDKGECTPVSADFKKDLPEALQTACAKCTQAQKHICNVYFKGLEEKLPAQFEEFKKKYDAENKFFSAFQAAVSNA